MPTVHAFNPSRLGIAAIGLLSLAAWMLAHTYLGLFHDSGLYTLQALARLHPESLAADVFLRYGSQDRFTLFSPLYAAVARALGIEPAAALLTLLLQIGFVGGAWMLARTVLPRGPAVLGVAFLIALPTDYGAARIFACIEPFLTPRMAAEAAVLAAIAAALRGSRVAAALTLAFAAVLHPIMAMAGVAALYCLLVGERRPVVAAAGAIVALKALALLAYAMPSGPWGRFDVEWLRLVTDRSPYLFLASWSLEDWSHAGVLAATLAVGAQVLDGDSARALARISLITGIAGLALTAIACDLLHLVPATEFQPWRWQWLAMTTAALLLPAILHCAWRRGDASGRTAAVLLAAAWLFGENPYALAAAAAAILALQGLHRLKPAEAGWVSLGAWGLATIAAVWRIATTLEFTEVHYLNADLPLWIRRAMSAARDGALAAALALSAWLGCRPAARAGALTVLPLAAATAVAAVACVALTPRTFEAWTAREFPPRQAELFGEMRAKIPLEAQVFWPESPLGTWMLLERPSYLSVIQTSGMVFSRPSARELERRATALAQYIGPATFMNWSAAGTGLNLSREQLAGICSTGAFDFLVTAADLDEEPAVSVAVPVRPSATRGTAGRGAAAHRTKLYRCRPAAG